MERTAHKAETGRAARHFSRSDSARPGRALRTPTNRPSARSELAETSACRKWKEPRTKRRPAGPRAISPDRIAHGPAAPFGRPQIDHQHDRNWQKRLLAENGKNRAQSGDRQGRAPFLRPAGVDRKSVVKGCSVD